MKITFLGVNGWYDNENGNTVCTLIETKNEYIILDAGFGLAKAGRYIKPGKPVYLFFSHFHIDHICGLHALPKIKFVKTITVVGPAGLKKCLGLILKHPYAATPKEIGLNLKVKELKPGIHNNFPFSLRALPLRHVDYTLGYRFSLENKIITYALDTAPCANAVRLGKNADLFITECSAIDQHLSAWGHCSPEDAAQMAKKAQAKKLALTHFGVSFDKKIRAQVIRRAAKVFPRSLLARDEMSIKI